MQWLRAAGRALLLAALCACAACSAAEDSALPPLRAAAPLAAPLNLSHSEVRARLTAAASAAWSDASLGPVAPLRCAAGHVQPSELARVGVEALGAGFFRVNASSRGIIAAVAALPVGGALTLPSLRGVDGANVALLSALNASIDALDARVDVVHVPPELVNDPLARITYLLDTLGYDCTLDQVSVQQRMLHPGCCVTPALLGRRRWTRRRACCSSATCTQRMLSAFAFSRRAQCLSRPAT